jgi:hypothetical protein
MIRRRGISLVELMVTMSACVVILTMSVTLIHRAMHAQSKSRLFFDVERSSRRLGDSFRRDVQSARSAEVGDEAGLLLRLEFASGQSVEYRQADGRVERLLHEGGGVRAREAFTFPPQTRMSAEKSAEGLVVLSVAADEAALSADRPLPSYTVPVCLHVEVVLGRNASLVDVADRREESP